MLIAMQIFSSAVMILWVVVAARTTSGAWRGTLFYAPCLRNLKEKGKVVVKDGTV